MSRQSKEAIVAELVPYIRQGLSRRDVLTKTSEKWHFSPRTFDRYWKFANDQHQEEQEEIRKQTMDAATEAALDAQNKAYLTIDSKRRILNEIAEGKLGVEVSKPVWDPVQKKFAMVKVIEYPDHGARVRAVLEDNKMMGHIAMDKGAGAPPASGDPVEANQETERPLKLSVDEVIKLAKAMNG